MTDLAMEDIARDILKELEDAWNNADGQAFGEPFTADADFVAIRGDYHHGRDAVVRGHQAIFDTIYRGSTQRYELLRARVLAADVILVQARGNLRAPTGSLAGEHSAIATLVLINQEMAWRIAAFHNTLVAPSR